jgi:hypothetical protein
MLEAENGTFSDSGSSPRGVGNDHVAHFPPSELLRSNGVTQRHSWFPQWLETSSPCWEGWLEWLGTGSRCWDDRPKVPGDE